MFDTLIGLVAAFCTTVSYLPQVLKAWRTRSTGDLSLKMMLLLSAGLSLWIVYGVLKEDLVIILANVVSVLLLANLVFVKAKEMAGERRASRDGSTPERGSSGGPGHGMKAAERTG